MITKRKSYEKCRNKNVLTTLRFRNNNNTHTFFSWGLDNSDQYENIESKKLHRSQVANVSSRKKKSEDLFSFLDMAG